ncbi:hypothetical protein [Vibrio fluvialis]|uniref:hypothetical protein n=1 Tax=Vibrio fluvialis TaxID=676 RepID=UPI002ACAC406|nr:hypothetical protein [Vibrio fluvialis]MDZ5513838.1 hypothetical protein [Vibrio fluvialis]
MGWIYLPSVSIQNGSNIVTVNNTATDSIKPGDGLLIGSYDLVEIIEVSIGQLKLKKNWSSANQSNAEAAVVPTFGDFNAATAALRQATTITQGNFAEMEKWWTQLGQVTFKAYNNTVHTVRTAKQMEQDVSALEVQANALIAEIAGAGYARSESDMLADRERNNQLFAASGHIHSGKTFGTGYSPINEGMFVRMTPVVDYENQFFIGCPASSAVGGSETNHPVFNLSGITVELRGINQNKTWVENILKLPPAPKGTEVYDAATGVLTNFETDVDPKYGDVAADTNEAVARAFEGMVKNGDFRLGDSFWSTPADRGTMSIQDGKCTVTDTTGLSLGGSAMWVGVEGTSFVNGETYVVELFVESLTNPADGWVRLGYYSDPNERKQRLAVGLNRFEFTAGTTNSTQGVLIYAGNNGTMVFSSFYVRKKSAEVVTSPVDLVGLEVFLRPINAADPFVYPYGMQQSKLTSVDGITTVENNVRPITHFEVYPGDTTSRGRGWNLLDGILSDAQKAKIFQNTAHNIYRMNDGTLAQWTVSQRTIRGVGNGYWDCYQSAKGPSLRYSTIDSSQVAPRGNQDKSPDYYIPASGALGVYYAANRTQPIHSDIGCFKAGKANAVLPSLAINGECYFYVIATVHRLNQGAYHPTLNPFGTKMCNTVGVSSSGSYWYDSNSLVPLTISECFKQIDATGDSITRGAAISTGAITPSYSGHPSNLRFNAIYASGQGGVIDQRYKYGAWDASSAEQAAVVREEVKNGTYRGREKLVFTHIQMGTQSSAAASTNAFTVDDVSKFVVGDSVSIVSDGVIVAKDRVVTSIGSSNITFNGDGIPRDVKSYYFVVTTKTRLTVEGEFTQTDVIGDPANILKCQALKDGWFGGWITVIPDGTVPHNQMPLTRKAKNATGTMLYSGDNGSTWASAAITYDQVLNVRDNSSAPDLGRITMYIYTASAKQTIPCNKSAVLNGDKGIGMVEVTQSYRTDGYSALLAESLSGKIQTSPNGNSVMGRCGLLSLAMGASGFSESGGWLGDTKHSPITLAAPANNGPAHKFLSYQKESSQQANLAYLWTELVHNGTDWGDDSLIHVADNISQRTDLNGNTVLYGTAELAKPYGFIKNKI